MFRRNWLGLNITRAPDDEGAGGGATPPADDKGAAAPAASDTSTPAAAPGGDAAAAPAATPAADDKGGATPAGDAPAADGKPAGDAASTPAAAATPDASATPDWAKRRESMIGALPQDVRDKAAKVLGKYASEDAAVLALLSADSKISELGEKAKGMVKVPGKDAKADDVAAFDKAWGVPEKAEQYEFKRGEGYQPTELEKLFDGKAKDVLKGKHFSQEQVDAVVELDNMRQELVNQHTEQAVKQSAEKAQDALRIAWGVNEYAPQIAAIQRYVDDVYKPMAGGKGDSFLDRRFADGTCLGEDPDFLKFMAQNVVNPWMDDNGMPRGGVPGGNASDDAKRKTEIMGMMNSTDQAQRKLYQTQAVQDELDGILKREQVRGRKAA